MRLIGELNFAFTKVRLFTTIQILPFVLQGVTDDLAMYALQDPQKYLDLIVSNISIEYLQQLALLKNN